MDSSVWIGYLRGTETAQTGKLDRLLGNEPLAIGDLILTEVLQGIKNDRAFHETQQMLQAFDAVRLGGHAIAIQAARNVRALRARGVTVRGTLDSIIATWCIENGYRLLHEDRDFVPFERHLGLRVV